MDQSFVHKCFQQCGVHFFAGVPDSYLNDFCNYLLKYTDDLHHVIAANEGNAIAIAAGYYFASGELPLVYMQNSGLGNAVNPLVSLTDTNVYAVPMILLIGWRGQPGKKDWPQHQRQGAVTTAFLEQMRIPYQVAAGSEGEFRDIVLWAATKALGSRQAVAIVVPNGVLSGNKVLEQDKRQLMSRDEAIETVLDFMPKDTVYSATTGRTTRELFYLRERRGESHEYDFLNVGSMGHASSVALGIAMKQKDRSVVCLDGDSAAIMHLGAMTMISKYCVPNFLHIILNNGVHDSVGGQPSAGSKISFTAIAKACGYTVMDGPIHSREGLISVLKKVREAEQAVFLDVRIRKGFNGQLPPLEFFHKDAIDSFMAEIINNGNS